MPSSSKLIELFTRIERELDPVFRSVTKEELKTYVVGQIESLGHMLGGGDMSQQLDDAYQDYCRLVEAYVSNQKRRQTSARENLLSEIRSASTLIISKFRMRNPEVNEISQTFSPQDANSFPVVLSAMKVNGEGNANMYVLGCFDYKKTFLSQQQRAIWLAAAIAYVWKKRKTPKVLVIGGGVAGVTACAALKSSGANVHLVERSHQLMAYQRYNDTRFIHPHLYDWPQPGSTSEKAGLPVLDWNAGYARSVIGQLETGFVKRMKQLDSSWRPEMQFDVVRVEQDGGDAGQPVYSVTSNTGKRINDVDVVIFAIGYGTDNGEAFGLESSVYWDNDNLSQSGEFTSENQRQILVSGSGDGGLIDVLRATVDNFSHSEILNILPGLNDPELQHQLLEIERQALIERESMPGVPYRFRTKYADLMSTVARGGDMTLRLNAAHRVTLNSDNTEVFTQESSILNRILVSYFLDCKYIAYNPYKLYTGMINDRADFVGGRYQIQWRERVPVSRYHTIIVRHGTDNEFFARHFKEYYDGCKDMGERLADLRLPTELSPVVIEVLNL